MAPGHKASMCRPLSNYSTSPMFLHLRTRSSSANIISENSLRWRKNGSYTTSIFGDVLHPDIQAQFVSEHIWLILMKNRLLPFIHWVLNALESYNFPIFKSSIWHPPISVVFYRTWISVHRPPSYHIKSPIDYGLIFSYQLPNSSSKNPSLTSLVSPSLSSFSKICPSVEH